MPQSIGIVGGRTGSSLYCMGCQNGHVYTQILSKCSRTACPTMSPLLCLHATSLITGVQHDCIFMC